MKRKDLTMTDELIKSGLLFGVEKTPNVYYLENFRELDLKAYVITDMNYDRIVAIIDSVSKAEQNADAYRMWDNVVDALCELGMDVRYFTDHLYIGV